MSDTTETQDSFLDFEKELLGDTAAAADAVVEPIIENEATTSSNTAEVETAVTEEAAVEAPAATSDEPAPATEAEEKEAAIEENYSIEDVTIKTAAPEEPVKDVPAVEAPVTKDPITEAVVAEEVEEAPMEEDAPMEQESETEETPDTASDNDDDDDDDNDDDDDDDDDDDFDILNIFSEQASSSELGAGVHERVRLISASGERRKDSNGNLVKKQLFLKFKKFSKDNVDLGEKEISFFIVDASKDTAVNNLLNFTAQVTEILSLFYSPTELEEKFDPFGRVFYNADNDDRDEEAVKADYHNTKIKKAVIKNEKGFTAVQAAICADAAALLAPFCGFEGPIFRLKLVESDDNKYIEIPRFDPFVEKAGVDKESSVLYKE